MDGTAQSIDTGDHDAHDLAHVQPITARALEGVPARLYGRIEDEEVDALVAMEKAAMVDDAAAYRAAYAEMLAARGRGEPYRLDADSAPIHPHQAGEELLRRQWERRRVRLAGEDILARG